MSENLISKEGLDDYATGKDGQRKTIYAGNESIKFLKPNKLVPENWWRRLATTKHKRHKIFQ
jgi:hypothetical protein